MIKQETFIIFNLIIYSISFFAYWDLIVYLKTFLLTSFFSKLITELIFFFSSILITFKFIDNLNNGVVPLLFFIFIIIGFFTYFLFLRDDYLLKVKNITVFIGKFKIKFIKLFKKIFYSVTIFSFKNSIFYG